MENKNFVPQGFSEVIFKERYSFTPEESWDEACSRVARQMALAEVPEKMKKYEEIFKEILVKNLFVPGGRIWYNSGRNNPQLLNCFVLGHELDSKEGWGQIAKEMIITSMTGGGCVDADTEYFNGYKWGKISKYNGGKVAQYTESGNMELVYPNEYIKYYATELTHFKTKYGIDQCLCDDHIVVYKNANNEKLEKKKFSEFKKWHLNTIKGADAKFITTFNSNRIGINLTDNEIRLMVAFIADGSFYNSNDKGIIRVNKKRKYKRLLDLLKDCNVEYKLHDFENSKYNVSFKLPISTKVFSEYFYNCNNNQLKIIMSEILNWDGSIWCDNRIGQFSTSKISDRDFIQYAAHSCGLRASISEDKRSQKINYKLSFSKKINPSLCSDKKNKSQMIPYKTKDGFKYCFVVPSHMLILRRNYNIFITGNCGIDFSDIRPNGTPVSGQKGVCPGPVTAMTMIDNCAEPVRQGGQRRVALMFSLDMEHPDIEEFLDAKLTQGKLSHANISVRCRDVKGFIKAVKEDGEIELSWKGQCKKKISAKKIWNKIVLNAHKNAEPGFLNWELALEENNIHYIEDLVTTNPCGEICLSSYDCCCLGHLVLSRFVKENGSDLEWSELANTIRTAVRFLDNVLTVNNYPLKEMKEKSNKIRRIGLGVTGLADMLILLGLKYGSEEGNKFIDKLHRFISKIAYESSVMLAIEKGPFPLFNAEKHLESGFMKRMTAKIRALVAEHGIRNCAILTIAPTGTVSILSDNCSSGIEPVFAPAYMRKFWKENGTRGTEIVFHPLFVKFMEEGKSIANFVSAHELNVKRSFGSTKNYSKAY